MLSIGFIAFVTEQWHHLPGAFVFALVGMACFMPGMNLATEQDLRKVNLSFLIFLAACMSIGAVAQDLNIPKWISAHMSSLFEGRGAVMAISFSYVLGVIVNFLMTPMAAVGALGSPLAQLADYVMTASNREQRLIEGSHAASLLSPNVLIEVLYYLLRMENL